jgi:hypothetical protein
MIGDSGPYASVGMKVLERAAGHASGPYVVPSIDVEAVAVRTNNSVCGAFRGFGANQAQFAMEGVMDRLAERVGMSGWEIRARATSSRPASCGVPARSWTMVASAPGPVSTRCVPPMTPRWPLVARSAWGRFEELRSRQRLQRGQPFDRAVPIPTASSRSATAGPRWVRASTPSPARSRSKSSVSRPIASR